ncbi:hypothetical protein [Streptosporangium vulgare]|uniref:Uncharacterized protein n=1 Tax=Streptosporangium vulgare TaxID=46190 RepID=A0ABV5TQH6_9ACTN
MPDLPPEAPEPEFPTRQALADAADGVGVASLVQDGYTADHLPADDTELRDAWAELESAVHALEAASQRLNALLPESFQTKHWREYTARTAPDAEEKPNA